MCSKLEYLPIAQHNIDFLFILYCISPFVHWNKRTLFAYHSQGQSRSHTHSHWAIHVLWTWMILIELSEHVDPAKPRKLIKSHQHKSQTKSIRLFSLVQRKCVFSRNTITTTRTWANWTSSASANLQVSIILLRNYVTLQLPQQHKLLTTSMPEITHILTMLYTGVLTVRVHNKYE